MTTKNAEAIAQHTPGPWKIINSNFYAAHAHHDSSALAIGTKEITVALAVSDDAEGDDLLRANARLIATAPKLLEVLEEFVSCGYIDLASNDWIYEEARAAIAKAKGESHVG